MGQEREENRASTEIRIDRQGQGPVLRPYLSRRPFNTQTGMAKHKSIRDATGEDCRRAVEQIGRELDELMGPDYDLDEYLTAWEAELGLDDAQKTGRQVDISFLVGRVVYFLCCGFLGNVFPIAIIEYSPQRPQIKRSFAPISDENTPLCERMQRELGQQSSHCRCRP